MPRSYWTDAENAIFDDVINNNPTMQNQDMISLIERRLKKEAALPHSRVRKDHSQAKIRSKIQNEKSKRSPPQDRRRAANRLSVKDMEEDEDDVDAASDSSSVSSSEEDEGPIPVITKSKPIKAPRPSRKRIHSDPERSAPPTHKSHELPIEMSPPKSPPAAAMISPLYASSFSIHETSPTIIRTIDAPSRFRSPKPNQPLQKEVIDWCASLKDSLPLGTLWFIQQRRLINVVFLGLACPFGYRLAVETDAAGLTWLLFELVDPYTYRDSWMLHIDREVLKLAQSSTGSGNFVPNVSFPNMPERVMIEPHPHANLDDSARIHPPTSEDCPIWTLELPILN